MNIDLAYISDTIRQPQTLIGLAWLAVSLGIAWAVGRAAKRPQAGDRWTTSCESCAMRWEGPTPEAVGQAYAAHYYRFHARESA